MNLSTLWKACASTLLVAVVAVGAMAQSTSPAPKSIHPLRMAKVDGHGRLIGPWIKVGQAGTAATYTVAFDCFEADANGNPTELAQYGPPINPPGSEGQRYYFGTGYRNPFATNDMTVAAGTAGTLATRVDLAWFWEGAVGEHCYLVVNTAETFGDQPTGPDYTDPYDGVVYDFGTQLVAGSFYISRVDLTGGLSHQMPTDGSGAYNLIIANDVTAQGITEASMCQPMLWLTKIYNPSFQDKWQWDDDNPTNGVHDVGPTTPPSELYDYTYAAISDRPLGAMIAFYDEVTSQTVAPTAYNAFRGLYISGDVASLAQSDDNYLVYQRGIVLSPSESPIDLNMTGTTTVLTPSSLSFVVESHASTPGLQQTTSLWNTTTSAWEQIDQRLIGTSDVSNTFTVTTNPARFVAADGTVKARVQFKQAGIVTQSNWRTYLDQTVWILNP